MLHNYIGSFRSAKKEEGGGEKETLATPPPSTIAKAVLEKEEVEKEVGKFLLSLSCWMVLW
jgi:hypothetical protein